MIVRELVTKLGFDSRDAEASAKRFDAGVSKVIRGLTGLKSALVTAAGAGGLFLLAKKASEAGDSLAKLSQELGINARQLQGWQFAAALAGVEQQSLNASLSIFSQRVGDAADGTKSALEPFQALGVRIRGANGELRENGEILKDVADGFARIKDPQTKAKLGQELFGRSGRRLQLLLSQGSAAIEKQTKRMEALGGVMGKDFLDQSERLNDNLYETGVVLSGLRNAIAFQVMKPLNNMIEAFMAWYEVNGEIIRQNISGFFDGLFKAVDVLLWPLKMLVKEFQAVASVLLALATVAIVRAIQGFGLLNIAMMASLGLAKAYRLAVLALAFGMKALRLAMLALPWVAIVAGLALVIDDLFSFAAGNESVIGRLVQGWQGFADWFRGLWDGVLSWFSGVGDKIASIAGAMNPGNWFGGPEAATAGMASTARGRGGAGVSVAINEQVTVNVPPGTTAEQSKAISQQVRRAMQDQFSQQFRQTLNDYPEIE